MSENRPATAGTITEWWKQYKERRESATRHHLKVFVRSFRPPLGVHRQREQLFAKIRDAEERNYIDGFDIHVTGESVCLCDQCTELTAGNTLRESIFELESWADEMLEPVGFERRDVNSSFTEESYPVLIPPERMFGIYLDGDLVGVFPCIADGSRYGVESYIDCLLADQAPAESAQRDRQAQHLHS
jgi:hypothetical protein